MFFFGKHLSCSPQHTTANLLYATRKVFVFSSISDTSTSERIARDAWIQWIKDCSTKTYSLVWNLFCSVALCLQADRLMAMLAVVNSELGGVFQWWCPRTVADTNPLKRPPKHRFTVIGFSRESCILFCKLFHMPRGISWHNFSRLLHQRPTFSCIGGVYFNRFLFGSNLSTNILGLTLNAGQSEVKWSPSSAIPIDLLDVFIRWRLNCDEGQQQSYQRCIGNSNRQANKKHPACRNLKIIVAFTS